MHRRRTRWLRWHAPGVLAAFLAGFPRGTMADEIRMLASNAVRDASSELLRAFEQETGHHVSVKCGGTVDIVRRAGASLSPDLDTQWFLGLRAVKPSRDDLGNLYWIGDASRADLNDLFRD